MIQHNVDGMKKCAQQGYAETNYAKRETAYTSKNFAQILDGKKNLNTDGKNADDANVSEINCGEVAFTMKMNKADLRQCISEYRSELYDKIIRGETDTKIAIGGNEYTIKGWDKLMETIVEAQEVIREAVRAEAEAAEEKAAEEKAAEEKVAEEKVAEEKVAEEKTTLRSVGIRRYPHEL